MKHIYLLFILFFVTQISLGQDLTKLNGFKYGIVDDIIYEGTRSNDLEFKEKISVALREFGITPLYQNDIFPDDLKQNPCLGVLVANMFFRGGNGSVPAYFSKLNFVDCRGRIALIIELRHQGNYKGALSKTLSKLKSKEYFFSPQLTPKIEFAEVENINKNENELKIYFDSTKLDPIEGIYKSYKSETNYKLGLIKVGDLYKAIIIESDYPQWKKGDVKAIFENTAAEGVFSTKWYLSNKTSIETFANLEGGLINIEMKNSNGESDDLKLLKLYPKN
ncbi:MAG: hypothetical protein ACOYLT_08110 [Flavobacterium sp.]|uniref:hypothetical protein n=1 Tax=Flavobacterium sp. TaxID=239 RepID=UPI003BC756B7